MKEFGPIGQMGDGAFALFRETDVDTDALMCLDRNLIEVEKWLSLG